MSRSERLGCLDPLNSSAHGSGGAIRQSDRPPPNGGAECRYSQPIARRFAKLCPESCPCSAPAQRLTNYANATARQPPPTKDISTLDSVASVSSASCALTAISAELISAAWQATISMIQSSKHATLVGSVQCRVIDKRDSYRIWCPFRSLGHAIFRRHAFGIVP